MKDVSQGEGRTVLFVSHNMAAIKMLCNKGILLSKGQVELKGTASECVDYYLTTSASSDIVSKVTNVSKYREHYAFLTHDIDFIQVEMLNEHPDSISTDEPLEFKVRLKCTHNASKFQICVFFLNTSDVRVLFCMTDVLDVPINKEEFDVEISIPNHTLPRGRYSVRFETNLQHFDTGSIHYDFLKNVLSFNVKYIHKEKKDEYLFWNSSFGETLQLEEKIPTRICSD